VVEGAVGFKTNNASATLLRYPLPAGTGELNLGHFTRLNHKPTQQINPNGNKIAVAFSRPLG
jgi:hypothetical protein